VRVPLPRGPARCRRAEAVALRAAPQKYDDATAPLAATLRSSEFAATAATLSKALAPSIGLAIVGTVAFGPLAVWLRTFINGEGLAVLANDEGQYFQNYVNAIDVMFSLLLVNTFAWLYNQQEQLYVSLFAEVSVAKALLEQIAYVSRGRPEYAAQLLENVRRYVDDDLTRLSAEPVTALLGGSSKSYADPLVQVMWLTSVGSPGDVYETVRSLREARGQRLGALQRKLPAAHFGLLAVLGVLVLAIFPLLAAATGAAVAPEDGLLRVQAVLFGLMTFAIAVAVCVEIIYLRRALYAMGTHTGHAGSAVRFLDAGGLGLQRRRGARGDDRRPAGRDRRAGARGGRRVRGARRRRATGESIVSFIKWVGRPRAASLRDGGHFDGLTCATRRTQDWRSSTRSSSGTSRAPPSSRRASR